MACSCLRQFITALGSLVFLVSSNPVHANDQECVILLHGLARTKFSMGKLASELKSDYQVINRTYPSRKYTVEELAKRAIEESLNECKDPVKIHFVTHSLGGILVRQYLHQQSLEKLGNVVMLGPPNQGSEIVDFFQQSPFLATLFDTANGPAGKQLGTNADSTPNSLGAVDFPLGVIAGSKSYTPFLANFLPGEGDGKVTIERSKVDGMIDHLVLPVDHTFMMRDGSAISQIKHFLKNGEFDHDDQSTD